jgi:two-component system CheB/CheR fusion protein
MFIYASYYASVGLQGHVAFRACRCKEERLAEHPQRLVVVGSSAGGIDALSEIVGGLQPDFAAPVVIAQHLDPRRPSHLTEILERRSRLEIRTVLDKDTLTAGVVYIVPADRNVNILDGTVSVSKEPDGTRPKPSVDRLFASAADAYGENLVAVVLTGAGSDGAEGARQVKLANGTVVIQDPSTARFPSMPQSLAPTTVDIVARLDTMADVLTDLVNRAELAPEEKEQQLLLRFLNQVRQQTGIDFAQYKRPTILRRLRRRMAAVRTQSLSDYVRYAARNPTEYDRLASTFLIKVTEFFRDPELYEQLRGDIIPRLVAGAAERDRELRIWSAGCATGEEAYSLAILVAEVLGDELQRHGVRIFATDVDNDAINFARRGVYTSSALANLSEEMVERYFVRHNDEYEIRKQIRAITVFGQHDLAQRAPFPRIDLAVSRNVLIYFTPELQRRALQLFAFSLRDDGYLVLGKAESVTPLPEHFTVENGRLKIYRRHGDRVLIPASRSLRLPDELAPMAVPKLSPRESSNRAQRSEGRQTLSERADQVLLRLPVGVVVIAHEYDIQIINTAARQQLAIHGTAVGQDFVHVARDIPSAVLRQGIDQARAANETSTTVELDGAGRGVPRTLRLNFYSHRVEQEREVSDGVIVVISDISEQRRAVEQLDTRLTKADQDLGAQGRQMSALEEANRELLRANQELTTANSELRSSNEELLVGSEEVQAATEEVETLNEELQATNEELETLNEELQATVEELNTTNDDLEARGVELEETLSTLAEQRRLSERERSRLGRLLLDREQGMLVIDAEGVVVLRNDAWRDLLEGSDAARFQRFPDGDEVDLNSLVADLLDVASRGDTFNVELQSHGPRGGQRRYELRGEGLRDEQGGIGGGIMTLAPKRAKRP